MSKLVRIIPLIVLLFMLVVPVQSQAAFDSFDQMQDKAESWLNQGKQNSKISEDKIVEIMLPIGQFLMGIGTVVLIVVTIIMGIKYMSASANPEAQAKLKHQMIGLVISGVVVWGAYGIWQIVYRFMDDVIK